MRLHKLSALLLMLLIAIVLSACDSERIFAPIFTPTPTVTSTFTPTFTITPTITPALTSTATIFEISEAALETPAGTPTLTNTPSPTFTPTPVGGGNGMIVFVNVSKTEENLEIYNIFRINVDGTGLMNLTNNSNPNEIYMRPRWSPDGQRILFQKIVGFGASLGSRLYVMNNDGSDVQGVLPDPANLDQADIDEKLYDAFGEFSPDGETIAFASNRHVLDSDTPTDFEIFFLDLKDNKISQMTNSYGANVHPTWSPDGTQMVFMSDRDGDWEIFVMDSQGNHIQQLTRNTADDRFPRWSPDGQSILYHSDKGGNIDLYRIDLGDMGETRLTDDPATDATASWSPDGNWIVFHSYRDGDAEIFLMKVDGSEFFQLTDNESTDVVASWGP